jgi:Protein of unknown function (DUF541)
MAKFGLVTAVSAAAILMTSSYALAQEDIIDFDRGENEVVLSLTTEGWVTTSSADVNVSFNITQQDETATDLRAEVLDKLKKLAPEEEWHVTSSRQSKDQTGLNRWFISATARVAEKNIADLQDRAAQLSRPGFKARIDYVNYAPSLAETQALMAKLRSKIYTEAAAEAGRLNKAFTGGDYKVTLVDFLPQNMQAPRLMSRASKARPMMAEGMMSTTADQQGGGGAQMPVSRKHTLSATIVFGWQAESGAK